MSEVPPEVLKEFQDRLAKYEVELRKALAKHQNAIDADGRVNPDDIAKSTPE